MNRRMLAMLIGPLMAGCASSPPVAAVDPGGPTSPSAGESPLPRPSGTLAISDDALPKDMSVPRPMMQRAGHAMSHDMPAMGPGSTTRPGENAALSAPRFTPASRPTTAPTTSAAVYTCPMHKQIVADGPGKCPICHMNLVVKNGAANPHNHEEH